MYKPQCEQPILLLNKFCLWMLQQGGELFIRGLRCPVPYLTQLPVEWLERARSYNDDDLENSYCLLNGNKEYLFIWVPCMKCLLCGHSKQQDLINRSILETLSWDYPPYFITLTYDPEHLPIVKYGNTIFDNGCLRYKDVQDFFKRLRIRWTRKGIQHDIRYLVAGEYGTKRGRPHYHILLWNNPYKCDEFQPWLEEQLFDDVFSSWGKCVRSAFDMGMCRGGAAPYATKYVSKPCNSHGHLVRPFIHTSAGSRGGLGSIFLRDFIPFLRENPVSNYLEFTDKKGNYNYMYFSRSINKKVWPSLSASVPFKLRETYRQLLHALTILIRHGVPFDDCFEVARVLCPRYVTNTLNPVTDICHCHLVCDIVVSKVAPFVTSLCDDLAVLQDITDYPTIYYLHKSLFVPQDAVSYAPKLQKIAEKLAVMDDKSLF